MRWIPVIGYPRGDEFTTSCGIVRATGGGGYDFLWKIDGHNIDYVEQVFSEWLEEYDNLTDADEELVQTLNDASPDDLSKEQEAQISNLVNNYGMSRASALSSLREFWASK